MGIKTIIKVIPGKQSSNPEIKAKSYKFREIITQWFRAHARSYPWRKTNDSYRTLIAEIMLQRTKSDQVVPVFRRFVKSYPNVHAVARARRVELAEILAPLGLSFRAQIFKKLSKIVVASYQGKIPLHAEDAIRLPGVGPYVASSLDAFLQKRRIPMVDANVARVLSRVFGVRGGDWRYATAYHRRHLYELAWLCIGRANPRNYHYALLDFAAAVCKSRDPACPVCPLNRAGLCVFCARRKGGRMREGKIVARTQHSVSMSDSSRSSK